MASTFWYHNKLLRCEAIRLFARWSQLHRLWMTAFAVTFLPALVIIPAKLAAMLTTGAVSTWGNIACLILLSSFSTAISMMYRQMDEKLLQFSSVRALPIPEYQWKLLCLLHGLRIHIIEIGTVILSLMWCWAATDFGEFPWFAAAAVGALLVTLLWCSWVLQTWSPLWLELLVRFSLIWLALNHAYEMIVLLLPSGWLITKLMKRYFYRQQGKSIFHFMLRQSLGYLIASIAFAITTFCFIFKDLFGHRLIAVIVMGQIVLFSVGLSKAWNFYLTHRMLITHLPYGMAQLRKYVFMVWAVLGASAIMLLVLWRGLLSSEVNILLGVFCLALGASTSVIANKWVIPTQLVFILAYAMSQLQE